MTTKPGSPSKTYHAFYATALQSAAGSSVPAEIRVYSPFNDTIHPDNTVAFVVAKAFFPTHDTVLLDASHVIPMPGDPSSDEYDNSLPDCPYPFLIGLGSVPSKFELLPDGVSKTFNVVSSDFIRDGVKSSTIQCAYNGSRARWSKTPAPNVNSVVQFFGTLDSASHSGDVRVNVDNIVLNVGHQDSPQPAPSSSTPVKKRKFNAFASPSASTSTATPSSVPSESLSSSLASFTPTSSQVEALPPPAPQSLIPTHNYPDAPVRDTVVQPPQAVVGFAHEPSVASSHSTIPSAPSSNAPSVPLSPLIPPHGVQPLNSPHGSTVHAHTSDSVCATESYIPPSTPFASQSDTLHTEPAHSSSPLHGAGHPNTPDSSQRPLSTTSSLTLDPSLAHVPSPVASDFIPQTLASHPLGSLPPAAPQHPSMPAPPAFLQLLSPEQQAAFYSTFAGHTLAGLSVTSPPAPPAFSSAVLTAPQLSLPSPLTSPAADVPAAALKTRSKRKVKKVA